MTESVSIFRIEFSQIHLFGRPVSLYVLIPVIGILFITAAGVLFAYIKKENISFLFRTNLLVSASVAVGILFKDRLPLYKELLPILFALMLFAVYAVYWLLARAFKKDRLYMLTQATLTCTLFPVFSQLGCFHAGCCTGRPYSGVFSVIYAPTTFCKNALVPLFPIRILEAMAFLLLFVAAFLLGKRGMKKEHFPIFILLILAVYYGGMALGAQECNALYLSGFNYSALLSMALLAVAVAWYIKKKVERTKL